MCFENALKLRAICASCTQFAWNLYNLRAICASGMQIELKNPLKICKKIARKLPVNIVWCCSERFCSLERLNNHKITEKASCCQCQLLTYFTRSSWRILSIFFLRKIVMHKNCAPRQNFRKNCARKIAIFFRDCFIHF